VPEAEGGPDPVPPPTPPGTEPPAGDTVDAQATRGQALYGQNCAACHGASGEGTGLGPALVGPEALPQQPPPERQVRTTEFRTAADIYAFTSQYMPADRPGALPQQTYLDILGFALMANGLALTEPLTVENAGAVVVNPRGN
jgi:hypothetical protein